MFKSIYSVIDTVNYKSMQVWSEKQTRITNRFEIETVMRMDLLTDDFMCFR